MDFTPALPSALITACVLALACAPDADRAPADSRHADTAVRRGAGDSLRVLGLDDFLRVELRVAVEPGVIEGRAEAHSDAAAERDSAGRIVDLRRAWNLRAVEVTCDSMPR